MATLYSKCAAISKRTMILCFYRNLFWMLSRIGRQTYCHWIARSQIARSKLCAYTLLLTTGCCARNGNCCHVVPETGAENNVSIFYLLAHLSVSGGCTVSIRGACTLDFENTALWATEYSAMNELRSDSIWLDLSQVTAPVPSDLSRPAICDVSGILHVGRAGVGGLWSAKIVVTKIAPYDW